MERIAASPGGKEVTVLFFSVGRKEGFWGGTGGKGSGDFWKGGFTKTVSAGEKISNRHL